jgi:hypothetical protein
MADAKAHPDLYKPDEAAEYLRLTSAKALDKLRSEGLLKGYDGYTPYYLYHREDLDRCAMRMCGRDPDAGKPKGVELDLDKKPGLKIAGGR